jgi:fluoroquinolone transport system permease protein
MSTRVLTLIGHDARLQYRYGIYIAYAFVLFFYLAVLVGARPFLPSWLPAFIIFSDPAALGFFFLGALMMLEKSEGVRAALAITPLGPGEYLAGKVITLTAMATLSSGLLVVVHGAPNPVLMVVTVALTSIMYVGIGVPIALRFRTVNGYLIGSSGFLLPVIAPGLVALIDPTPAWTLVLPATSQLKLMLVATGAGTAGLGEIVFMLVVCAIAAAGGLWLAYRALVKEIGR